MQEFSPIKQRILQLIDFEGISKYDFYKKSGITRGILDQPNGISEENTAKFLAYRPDINLEWLLTGKGEMLRNSEKKINNAGNYDKDENNDTDNEDDSNKLSEFSSIELDSNVIVHKLIGIISESLKFKDKQIDEQNKHIAEQNKNIAEQNKNIAEQNRHISEQHELLKKKDEHIDRLMSFLENNYGKNEYKYKGKDGFA